MKLFWKILLFPFSVIYGLITGLRNHLYNINYSRSFKFDRTVMSVGNLRVGGSGKTPMVEYLIRLLKDRYKLATLSRGYGRSTHGFRIASEKDDFESIGDEPYQYYMKFGSEVTVAVGEDRALAIPNILFKKEQTEVVLLDDAFQHRAVIPDLNILLTEYHRPFYKDYILPAGRLRESRKGAGRADVILVTKCPEGLDTNEEAKIVNTIHTYSKPDCPVFFTRIRYGNPMPLYEDGPVLEGSRVNAFCGIANPESFRNFLKSKYQLNGFRTFPDHYRYTVHGMIGLVDKTERLPMITTEKDRVKLLRPEFREVLEEANVFYIPIRHEFLRNGTQFDELIINSVKAR